MWSYIPPHEDSAVELGDRRAGESIVVREPIGLARGTRPTSGGIDTGVFRRAMSHFATGVAIITTLHEGELYGMTANSVTSVSLQPALILVCVARGARTGSALLRTGRLVVNILRHDQAEVSSRFAGSSGDKFEGVAVDIDEDGVPHFSDCLAYLRCRIRSVVSAGDHDVVFAEVEHVRANGGAPLLFYLGGYRQLPETTVSSMG